MVCVDCLQKLLIPLPHCRMDHRGIGYLITGGGPVTLDELELDVVNGRWTIWMCIGQEECKDLLEEGLT
jgi:hypothetical protein